MNNDFGPFRWWRVAVAVFGTAVVALATILSVSIIAGIIR